ncbi:MAG TPA: hypothetical protein VIY73_01840, partial [Polyangiaceae bacterium]
MRRNRAAIATLLLTGGLLSCTNERPAVCVQQQLGSFTSVQIRFLDPRQIAVDGVDGAPLLAVGA